MQGTVKWFSPDKGYGFICGDDGTDYFFSSGSLIGSDLPGNGDTVIFTGRLGKKGFRAIGVSIISRFSRRPKTVPEIVFRWLATDHYGTENALRTIPGLGFWENLKFVTIKLLITFIAILLTGALVFLLIAYGLPWFLFGSV